MENSNDTPKPRGRNYQEDFQRSSNEPERYGSQDQVKKKKVTIRETGNDEVVLVYNEKEFPFPKNQPGWVAMFVALHGEGEEKELPDEESLRFIIKLVGRDLAEEIVKVADPRFSIADVVEQIIEPIQSYWSSPEQIRRN